ncbi:uncharacterized protein LOC128987090 [Macrosteles quadrilineatus]|nr:uncharacterized protein LOC128987090 [Macrosteles quadrilineatus]
MEINFDFVEEESNLLEEVSQPVEPNLSLENIKKKIADEVENITRRVTNMDQGIYILQELKKMSTTVDAMNLPSTSTSTLKITSSVSPANANIIQQRRFTSTKKVNRKSQKFNNKKISKRKRDEIAFNLLH